MEIFVEGWRIVQTLGEGAYGEVKLLLHDETQDKVAVKIVNYDRSKDARDSAYKEYKIHGMLDHPNIIKFLGNREEKHEMYMFIEFAADGELFDKIDPDVGMHSSRAQKYMKHLLEGVKYLHGRGFAHRDIKPENLLIDSNDVLKISDFGLATIFRFKGKERLLDKRCGTLPYVAPDVLNGPYHAQPADLWSCGIVFAAMLTGELPWNEPTTSSKEFAKWSTSTCITEGIWRKMSTMAYSLVRKLLNPDAKKRLKLQDVLDHTWMKVVFAVEGQDVTDLEPKSKRIALARDNENSKEIPLMSFSQPVNRGPSINPAALSSLLASTKSAFSFSQPVHNDDLYINSMPFTQNQPNKLQSMVKRMTRFHVKTNQQKTVFHLCNVLDQLEYPWTVDYSGVITVSTIDMLKIQLVFKIGVIEMDDKVLVDFRLSKGCGIEFKRRFMKLKMMLVDIQTK